MKRRLIATCVVAASCMVSGLFSPAPVHAGGVDEVSFTNASCSFVSPLDGTGCTVSVSCSASTCLGSVTVSVTEPGGFETVILSMVTTAVGPVNANGSWSGVINGGGIDDGVRIVAVGRASWTSGACLTCNALNADIVWGG